MKTFVEFESESFPGYAGEEEKINPGLFGARLAEYLLVKLPPLGIPVTSFGYEDWGCYLPFELGNFNGFIGCTSTESGWCYIQLSHRKAYIRRFPYLKKIDISTELQTIVDAIDQVLRSEPGISNIDWQESN